LAHRGIKAPARGGLGRDDDIAVGGDHAYRTRNWLLGWHGHGLDLALCRSRRWLGNRPFRPLFSRLVDEIVRSNQNQPPVFVDTTDPNTLAAQVESLTVKEHLNAAAWHLNDAHRTVFRGINHVESLQTGTTGTLVSVFGRRRRSR